MSEGFAAAVGRKVISRASGEELGQLTHLVVDVAARRVSSLVVGKGRRARIAEWKRVSGFGPDAVILDADDALHPPAEGPERSAAHGDLDLVGKRALSERGNETGKIDDVIFDGDTGELLSLVVGSREHPSSDLLGVGSYAVVIGAPVDGPPADG